MAKVTLKGNTINTNGELPAIGSDAPAFKLTAADLSDKTLSDFTGKKKILSIVPSLDTQVCAVSTEKFNQASTDYSNCVFIIVSADLPFAQQRFTTDKGLNNIITLSEMRDKTFSKDYGMLIQDGPLTGITARAVVVIDENDKVIYTQLVPEITEEPDYQKVYAVL